MPKPEPVPPIAPTAPAAWSPLPEHIPALDGLRGLAILLVLMNNLYEGPASHFAEAGVLRLFKSGWCGVDLFFVLSGFLITGILYDSKDSPGYFRNFYARRFLRIFPLYYGFLLLWVLLVPHIPTFTPAEVDGMLSKQGWYWAYLANINVALQTGPAGAEPRAFWSLAVEEQFYLLWPLVVLLANRRQLVRISIGMIAAAFALRLAGRLLYSGLIVEQSLYTLTPARMDALAIGSLLAVLVRSPDGLARLSRLARPVATGAVALLLLIFLWKRGLHATEFTMQTAGYSIIGLGSGALLVLCLAAPAGSVLHAAFTHPVMRSLGRYSYGTYVFHGPLYLVFRTQPFIAEPPRMFGSQLPAALAGSLLLALASIALAVLSWHGYEKQFLKLKTYFPYGRSPRSLARHR
jgi:peptidoglycan/LPS O-acetylase OafA/YrhL